MRAWEISLGPLATLFFAFLAFNAAATTYYVDIKSPNPEPPYTSWATAATNIQDAINAAANGNLIMVNPGVYQTGGETVNGYGLTNRVAITSPLIVESTEGPTNTIIQGYQVPGSSNGGSAVRCVYMTNNAVLIGFTLKGGATLGSGDSVHEESGGGVWCESTNATIFNCIITGNAAFYAGGGAAQGTLQYCALLNNTVYGATSYGGGAYDGVLANCTVVSNSIYCTGQAFGGGVYNCGVTNSALAGNSAFSMHYASEGGGAYMGNLVNCNITGNTAADGGGTFDVNEVNCINYFNTLYTNGPMIDGTYTANYWGYGTITYSCTVPNPHYAGDITNDPQLASFSHISLSSPCCGAGTASASSGVDIDSNQWANPPSMGCFEPHPGSVLGNLSVGISTLASNWAPGFELNFEANISGPVYSNLWSFGDGTFATNEAYASHTWSATGVYPVTLTAYNDSYPAGVTTTLVVNVAVPSTFYVNLNNRNPFPPYLNWDTAAASIQDAVNVAGPGSVVLVTNGPTLPIYPNLTVTNSAAVYLDGGAEAPNGNFYRVMVTNPITVESVSGPSSTYILGGTPGSGNGVGCVYLTDGATLSGFMLTNGNAEYGGGICAASTNALATNCVITGCSGSAEGGSVYLGTLWNCLIEHNDNFGAVLSMLNYCTISGNSQGGAEQCKLNNCTLTGNTVAEQASILNNCVISSNSAAFGAGAYGGTLNNCMIVSNTASEGAGAYGAEYYPVVLNNCVISNNTAQAGAAAYGQLLLHPGYCFMTNCIVIHNSASGGAVYGALVDNCELIGNAGAGASDSTLNQCTLLQNSAARGGGASLSSLTDCLIISNSATDGIGGGVVGCSLTNCILTYNASPSGGWGGAAEESTLVNCTVTANSASSGGGVYDCTANNCILYYNTGGDWFNNDARMTINDCCTPQIATNGFRNITNAPLFVNAAANDFHLQANSPCINAGQNLYITSASGDFGGNARIVGGTVDIGAYEYQTPTSIISYAYLQHYGLPADGSVDFSDLDGTAFNVYEDWIAGLNPTNPASILAMDTLNATNNTGGITVSWQSVVGIPYNLQRATNLTDYPPFTTIQFNIAGQPGTTSYQDVTATNGGPYFYRVNVVAP